MVKKVNFKRWRRKMKKVILLTVVLIFATAAAFAGGYNDPPNGSILVPVPKGTYYPPYMNEGGHYYNKWTGDYYTAFGAHYKVYPTFQKKRNCYENDLLENAYRDDCVMHDKVKNQEGYREQRRLERILNGDYSYSEGCFEDDLNN